MKSFIQQTAVTAVLGVTLASAASAAEILVNADITVSTTWTSNNTYNLQKQIYVRPGATLTIEAGTVIASTTNLGGSLAVTRGAQIMVLGTESAPVIMTSKADVATWGGGNPANGVWREAASEWGNLTIMGSAYISEDSPSRGNSATPGCSNDGEMEGLTPAFVGDPDVLYGGCDDLDDSGSISYLSLRYGGKVVSLANELNGLSLGGLGRGTDIDHIDIMNNVDDGIEIWGGCPNLKYINIWNIGDDSLDIDQGYRGKIQNVCIVQGYSIDASQGSGVGDNAIETDGAEDSDWQPVTTTVIYNATVIGQPVDGDGLTAWRDNARVQYRNSIFMDCGENVVRFDNVDGDGGSGYGFNGTLSWADTWTTDWTATSPVNPFPNPATAYKAQSSGKLAEITDSVFFRNLAASAYTEATARGVFDAGNNNVLIPGFAEADAPVVSITRGAAVVRGGKTMLPVISLDPRAANEATTSVAQAPNDGFFCQQMYRGAFSPTDNWLKGWTAASDFGFTGQLASVANRTGGNVQSYTSTPVVIGQPWTATIDLTTTGHTTAQVLLHVAPTSISLGPLNTLLVAGPRIAKTPFLSGPIANFTVPIPNDPFFCGLTLYTQAWHFGGAGGKYRLTNAQDLTIGTF